MRSLSRLFGVGACALTLLFFAGCGHDKNLSPTSDLIYDGPYPATQDIDVNPPFTHLEYFLFHIVLSDPNLSIIPADAWVIDSATGTFATVDPNHHLLAPLPDVNIASPTVISSRTNSQYAITLMTQDWLTTNAPATPPWGTDVVNVTLTMTVRAHRNRDGVQKTFPITWSFTLRDIP